MSAGAGEAFQQHNIEQLRKSLSLNVLTFINTNPRYFIRLLIVPFCFSAFFSCSKQTQDPSLTIKNIGTDHLMTLNFKEIKDSLRISLSDFATGFQFIPLETRPECLLAYADCLVTKEYILCESGEAGILQFSRDGRFIRKLVTCGKGPIEVAQNFQWAVDEERQALILSSSNKAGYFLNFDLKTGAYLKDIPNAVPSISWQIRLTGIRKHRQISAIGWRKSIWRLRLMTIRS